MFFLCTLYLYLFFAHLISVLRVVGHVYGGAVIEWIRYKMDDAISEMHGRFKKSSGWYADQIKLVR